MRIGFSRRQVVGVVALMAWSSSAADLLAAEGKPTTGTETLASTWSDWPQWLGPARDGSSPEKGLLREWPAEGPKVLWKAPLGKGYGVPTVSGGQLFVLGNSDKPGSGKGLSYWCLDAFTGKQVWRYDYEWKKAERAAHPGWGWCTKGSVAVTDKHVYGIDDLGVIHCLDRATGAKVWSRDLDEEYQPSHYDWKGWCMTPLVMNDVLVLSLDQFYASTNARLAGLDAKTGKTLWLRECHFKPNGSTMLGGGHYQTPALVNFGGEPCALFCSAVKKAGDAASGGLVALRPTDGKVVWEYSEGLGNLCTIQTPFVQDDLVILLDLWQPIKGYQLSHKSAPFALKPLWTCNEVKSPYTATVLHEGHLYTFSLNGIVSPLELVCIDAGTGKVAWKEQRNEFTQCVSLALADGLLFVRGSNMLLLVEATPKGFVTTGQLDMGFKPASMNPGWIMPALAYGRLYVRCDADLWCLQVAKTLPSAEEAVRQ